MTTVRITSTSFCTWAGLKKCIPTTRRGCPVDTEMSVTPRLEVLVASTASSRHSEPSLAKMSFLSSSRSGTASITMSAGAASSRLTVKWSRASSSSASASLIFPRLTARWVEDVIRARDRSIASSSTSTPITDRPLRASTSATPAPMVPSPITATVANSRGMESSSTGPRRR